MRVVIKVFMEIYAAIALPKTSQSASEHPQREPNHLVVILPALVTLRRLFPVARRPRIVFAQPAMDGRRSTFGRRRSK
jgi:hypothetical protein